MIGDRIKEIRQKAGLTQTAFSARIGIKQPSLNAIERGDNNPSDQTVFIICREFRVNEEWLRTGKDKPYIDSPSSISRKLADEYRLCPEAAAMVGKFVELDTSAQRAVFAYMCAVVDEIRNRTEPKVETKTVSECSSDEVKELCLRGEDMEKKQAAQSEA